MKFLLILLFIYPVLLKSEQIYLCSSVPVASIVSEIVGSGGRVKFISPASDSPNSYQITTDDILLSHSSLLFFYSSDSTSPWIFDLPAKNKINLSELIPPEDVLLDSDSNVIPYFWMNPILTSKIAEKIADSLSFYDSDNSAKYKNNAASFANRLSLLGRMIESKLKNKKRLPLWGDVNTLAYFSAEFGFSGGKFLSNSFSSTPGNDSLLNKFKPNSNDIFYYNTQLDRSSADYFARHYRVKNFEINVWGDSLNTRYYEIITSNLGKIVLALP
jgi:ABC-type Zn uptake system ZnuABC Zn-binding protein ZnuA